MDNKEKYIIETISNHRESVDTDALWAGLEGSIPEKKKKRGAFWLWFAAFSLVGTIFYTKYLNNYTPLNQEVIVHNTELERPVAQLPSDELLESKEQSSKSKLVKTDTKRMASSVSKDIEVEGNKDLEQNSKAKNPLIVSKVKDTQKGIQEYKGLTMNELDVVNDQTHYYDNESKQNTKEGRTVWSEGNKAEKSYVEIEKLTQNELQFLEYRIDEPWIMLDLIPYVDLKKESSRSRWSFLTELGALQVTRELSTQNSEYLDIVNRRNEIESVLGGWQISTGVAYQLTPRLSMFLGLEVLQIQERASFTSNYIEEKTVEDQILTIVHNQDGTVTNLVGSSNVLFNRSTNEIRNNYFRQLMVPISVDYNLFEKGSYKWSFNGSAAYSFHQAYNGFTSINENQASYALDDDPNGMFDTHNMISYGIGTNISKLITKNLDLTLGLEFRNLGNMNTNLVPMIQKYRTYALTLGARYTL